METNFAQLKGDLDKSGQQQGAAQQKLLADGADRGDPNARVKSHVGVWAICEDQHGEYYHNTATQTSYDDPPPELARLLQRQPPQQQAQQQLRPMHASPQQQHPPQQRPPQQMQA